MACADAGGAGAGRRPGRRAAARRPAPTARPRARTRRRPPPARCRTSWRASSRVPAAAARKASEVSALDLLTDGAGRIRDGAQGPAAGPRAPARDDRRGLPLERALRPGPAAARRGARRAPAGARPDDPSLADPLQSIAMLDRQAGRSADAEAPLREAIRILRQLRPARQRLAPADDPRRASSPTGATSRRRSGCCWRWWRSASSTWATVSDLAATLNNLGNLYSDMRRYPDAVRVHERGLAMKEKVLGKRHFFVAQSLNNLANVYLALDRFEQAAEPPPAGARAQAGGAGARPSRRSRSASTTWATSRTGRRPREGRDAVPARARDWRGAVPARARPYLGFSDGAPGNVYRDMGRRRRRRGLRAERHPADPKDYGPGNAAVNEVQAEYAKLKTRTASR